MEIDPVCGMEVDPKTAPSTTCKGKTYYFCGPEEATLSCFIVFETLPRQQEP